MSENGGTPNDHIVSSFQRYDDTSDVIHSEAIFQKHLLNDISIIS